MSWQASDDADVDVQSPSRPEECLQDGGTPPPAVPPKSPLRANHWASALITVPRDTQGWQAIGEWAQKTGERELVLCDKTNGCEDLELQTLDPAQWENVTSRMKAANSNEMLYELQGLVVNQTRDVHKEIQKQRWMVYALHHLDRANDGSSGSMDQSSKVLVLFDSIGGHSESLVSASCKTKYLF